MPDRVRITDVSPRDGLQNEPAVIPATQKAALCRLLFASGVDEVEVSSFVSAKWVPQLGDAAEVFALLSEATDAPLLSALVPNEKGLEAALDVNRQAGRAILGKVSVFTAASESFTRRNTNATIAETLARFVPVVRRAREAGLLVRGYISCAIACPFEGPISPEAVVRVCRGLADLGVDELDLGDTIGAGTADSVAALLGAVGERWHLNGVGPAITLHLHDTFGRASSCISRALALGVRSFDGSASGLGGCPYASTPDKHAPGNISTETLVRTIRSAGYECRVDDAGLAKAAAFAANLVGRG